MKEPDFGFGARLAKSLFALGFALVFTLIGIQVGFAPLYSQLHDRWEADSYVPVPAHVKSTSLDQWPSRKSGPTYRAKAEFNYEFRGRAYHGDRINFSQTADHAGGYQHDIYAQLEDARLNSRPVNLWVDPLHPEHSVYDRSTQWDDLIMRLVYGLLFTPIGLWAWVFVYRAWRV